MVGGNKVTGGASVDAPTQVRRHSDYVQPSSTEEPSNTSITSFGTDVRKPKKADYLGETYDNATWAEETIENKPVSRGWFARVDQTQEQRSKNMTALNAALHKSPTIEEKQEIVESVLKTGNWMRPADTTYPAYELLAAGLSDSSKENSDLSKLPETVKKALQTGDWAQIPKIYRRLKEALSDPSALAEVVEEVLHQWAAPPEKYRLLDTGLADPSTMAKAVEEYVRVYARALRHTFQDHQPPVVIEGPTLKVETELLKKIQQNLRAITPHAK